MNTIIQTGLSDKRGRTYQDLLLKHWALNTSFKYGILKVIPITPYGPLPSNKIVDNAYNWLNGYVQAMEDFDLLNNLLE